MRKSTSSRNGRCSSAGCQTPLYSPLWPTRIRTITRILSVLRLTARVRSLRRSTSGKERRNFSLLLMTLRHLPSPGRLEGRGQSSSRRPLACESRLEWPIDFPKWRRLMWWKGRAGSTGRQWWSESQPWVVETAMCGMSQETWTVEAAKRTRRWSPQARWTPRALTILTSLCMNSTTPRPKPSLTTL